jgi:predicted signal transduction protein with EAL and GGDEF domain
VLRDGDSVARFGGDEFAVLLNDITSTEQVELVCHRTLAALRPEILIKGHEVVVEASLGVAIATSTDGADDLLHNADMAMYQAKSLGKGQYAIYKPELRAKNIRRLELIERLRSGITSELVVHYQPIVDLRAGTVSGLEALVRWERDGQVVPPDYFIGIAEQSGLVVQLGAQVMAQVVRDSAALRAAAGRPLALGINVSALQLREPSFRASVAAACAGLSGHQLVLEMTETVLIGDDAETAASLRELAGYGAALAIDDFGVGFSSVGYLQHMPVDILKIDRSFTADIDTDERADALVGSMVLMGGALGLRVVAEGIERPGQLERVCRTGCASGQGYLFSPPRPLKEIVALLEAEHDENSWLDNIMLAAAATG